MATYTVIQPFLRDTAEESVAFPTSRRTRWVATLRIGAVDPGGGAITVSLQGSPTADEDLFEQIYSFGPLDTQSVVTKRSYGSNTPDFTVQPYHLYLRGVIDTIEGIDWAVELLLESPFFDPSDAADIQLLTKELRLAEAEERDRLVRLAERDLVDLLVTDRSTGSLEAWTNAPGFLDAMKQEIVEQADHLFRREQLARRKDAESTRTLRQTGWRRPELGQRLRDFRPHTTRGWVGRG